MPVEHRSGTSSPDDLSAGFFGEQPFLSCKHATRVQTRELSGLLNRRYRPSRIAEVCVPPSFGHGSVIGAAMQASLELGGVSSHRAPTGSGETHSLAQIAATSPWRQTFIE